MSFFTPSTGIGKLAGNLAANGTDTFKQQIADSGIKTQASIDAAQVPAKVAAPLDPTKNGSFYDVDPITRKPVPKKNLLTPGAELSTPQKTLLG